MAVPNTEEVFEGLVTLLQQCGLCCNENGDGELAEFLGRRLEEYQRTLRVMYGWVKKKLLAAIISDQKLSSHFLIYKKYKTSVLDYITSNSTFKEYVIHIEFMNCTIEEVVSIARSMI